MHLCGHLEDPDSLVLTEDDYLDFAISLSKNEDLIPSKIRRSFVRCFLLFLGYRFRDPDLWVTLRCLSTNLSRNSYSKRKLHIAVHLTDLESFNNRETAVDFLKNYFETQYVSVCFMPLQEFLKELQRRWEAS
jgi:hypothetical protein